MEGLVELIDLVEEYEGKFNWVDELPDIMCGLLLDEDAPEQLYATLQGIATPPDGSLSPVSAFIDEILKIIWNHSSASKFAPAALNPDEMVQITSHFLPIEEAREAVAVRRQTKVTSVEQRMTFCTCNRKRIESKANTTTTKMKSETRE